MGGCATKPKEVEVEAPVPKEEEEEEEKAAGKLSDSKVVIVAEKVKKIYGETEIVEDDAAEEHGNKRRSLSNLFKEDEGKDSTEYDMTSLDRVKREEPSVNEKTETQAEQMPREEVEVEAEPEKKVEVALSTTEAIQHPAATEMPILEGKQLLEDKTEAPEEMTTKGEEKCV